MTTHTPAPHYIDTNLVQFQRSMKAPVGSVDKITVDPAQDVTISLTLRNAHQYPAGSVAILVVDKYQRYLHHAAAKNTQSAGLDTRQTVVFSLSRLLNLPPENAVEVYLLFCPDNVAIKLDAEDTVYTDLTPAIKEQQPEPVPEVPTFRPQLLKLVLSATNHKYVSRSNQNCIVTGNNYQTLELGETLRLGGRVKRLEKIRQIDFRGKNVLDIGANTGEISRYVRRLGARLVDGYEYDSFFVETGRMINAYTGATRVSLFQGDATNPSMYSDTYDIVVALSVYVYIKDVLKQLSEVTDAMLFETHTLDHGLDFYLKPICKHFPFFRHLGFTDVDPNFTKSRALLLFTTKQESLDELVVTDKFVIPPGTVNYYYNDDKHKFAFDKVLTEGNLELLKANGFDHFLGHIEEQCGPIELSSLKEADFRFFSPVYWLLYLLGYKDYLNSGCRVNNGNRFLKYYCTAIEAGVLDPSLKYLLSEKKIMYKKLELKYQDLDHIRKYGIYALPPIQLSADTGQPEQFTFESIGGGKITSNNIDGHHRLFLAKLFDARAFPFYETGKKSDAPQVQVVQSRYTLSDE